MAMRCEDWTENRGRERYGAFISSAEDVKRSEMSGITRFFR